MLKTELNQINIADTVRTCDNNIKYLSFMFWEGGTINLRVH